MMVRMTTHVSKTIGAMRTILMFGSPRGMKAHPVHGDICGITVAVAETYELLIAKAKMFTPERNVIVHLVNRE
jgi:hypothetical protein